MPMLAALIVQRFVARRPILGATGLGLRLGLPRVSIVAVVLTAALVLAAFGTGTAIDPGSVKDAATLAKGGTRLALPDLGGPFATLSAGLLITVLLAPVLNLPLMLGEEIGWRGFLTPRLVALLGRRGVVVAGVIWAAWHLPIAVPAAWIYLRRPEWLGHWTPERDLDHSVGRNVLASSH